MALRYVDTTATYNGDGTASNQAASAGAPGAWNDLLTVMRGAPAYGSLSDGDVVYLRSHDGSNNITVNVTSALTMATRGSLASPVVWRVDDGTVWAQGGVLILNFSTGVTFAGAGFNHLLGGARRFRFRHNQGNATFQDLRFRTQVVEGLIIETVNSYGAWFQIVPSSATNDFTWFRNCLFDISQASTYEPTNYGVIGPAGSLSCTLFEACDFDLTGAPAGITLFTFGTSPQRIRIVGGNVIGGQDTQAVLGWPANTVSAVDFRAVGFNAGPLKRTNANLTAPGTNQLQWGGEWVFANLDTDFRFLQNSNLGVLDWTPAANYPTLDARLPGTDTPWSLRVTPKVRVPYQPLKISNISKFNTLAAGVRTVKVRVLLCNTFSTPTRDAWFIDVYYVDAATGNTQMISSYGSGNVDTSSANWSTTTYGAKSYNKYEFSITTPTAVRQNTDIYVELKSDFTAPASDDFYFVDPDPVIA